MKSNPKFSIIVPVYNEEKYLAKCVNSLRNQTLQNIEIILIDDGSTDRSRLIADWYARQDLRVRVFHQQNSGQGPARNFGMKQARGKYIGFVDADDWVEPEMFQQLYERAEKTNTDMVFTGVKLVNHGQVTQIYQHSCAGALLTSPKDLSDYRCQWYGPGLSSEGINKAPGYVVIGGFRRSFVATHHLCFHNLMSEDTVFLLQAFQAARSVAFVPGSPYCYRRDNQVSTTNSFNTQSIDLYKAYMKETRHLLENEFDNKKHECLIRWDRNVIDLSRELVHRIEDSVLSSSQKSDFIHKVNVNSFLKEASYFYSWHKLPLKYVLFYWYQIKDRVGMERLIMKMWILASYLGKYLSCMFHKPHKIFLDK